MQHKIFTIYDVKAECYLPPFNFPKTAMAIRVVTANVADPEHMFCQFPADYTLFELADYDDATGKIHPYNAPLSLGSLVEFKGPPFDPTPPDEMITMAQATEDLIKGKTNAR